MTDPSMTGTGTSAGAAPAGSIQLGPTGATGGDPNPPVDPNNTISTTIDPNDPNDPIVVSGVPLPFGERVRQFFWSMRGWKVRGGKNPSTTVPPPPNNATSSTSPTGNMANAPTWTATAGFVLGATGILWATLDAFAHLSLRENPIAFGLMVPAFWLVAKASQVLRGRVKLSGVGMVVGALLILGMSVGSFFLHPLLGVLLLAIPALGMLSWSNRYNIKRAGWRNIAFAGLSIVAALALSYNLWAEVGGATALIFAIGAAVIFYNLLTSAFASSSTIKKVFAWGFVVPLTLGAMSMLALAGYHGTSASAQRAEAREHLLTDAREKCDALDTQKAPQAAAARGALSKLEKIKARKWTEVESATKEFFKAAGVSNQEIDKLDVQHNRAPFELLGAMMDEESEQPYGGPLAIGITAALTWLAGLLMALLVGRRTTPRFGYMPPPPPPTN